MNRKRKNTRYHSYYDSFNHFADVNEFDLKSNKYSLNFPSDAPLFPWELVHVTNSAVFCHNNDLLFLYNTMEHQFENTTQYFFCESRLPWATKWHRFEIPI